jgi:SAM-dependent methyltransferase
MSLTKIKESVKIIRKDDISYILDDKGKIKRFKPWLGDMFSFLYDRIMEKSVFPNKFKGSIAKHLDILKEEYQDIHCRNLLEIATGSGFSAFLLNNDNSYTGIDISSGLLFRAVEKFKENDFHDAEFFVADACEMPFNNEFFDVAICDLSLNFLGNIETFINELNRVMKKGSIFYCSVPVPERIHPKVTIHGNLYSEDQLKTWFEKFDFSFVPKPFENGALLYFEARALQGVHSVE